MVSAIGQISVANYLSGIIDPVCAAVIAAKSSDIGQRSAVPKEGVVRKVARNVRESDDLAAVIDGIADAERCRLGCRCRSSCRPATETDLLLGFPWWRSECHS
jgi:hypothetical protein